jgi:hypothetical protein
MRSVPGHDVLHTAFAVPLFEIYPCTELQNKSPLRRQGRFSFGWWFHAVSPSVLMRLPCSYRHIVREA